MTKKHFIALANAMRATRPPWKANGDDVPLLHQWKIDIQTLADVLQNQNPRFKRDRWLGYCNGECGPNGGSV